MTAGPRDNPLLPLIALARRARAAANADELAFLCVNDTRELMPYRQAALWFDAGGVHTLSGVVPVETNAPYVQWLNQLCRLSASQHDSDTPVSIDTALLPADLAATWDEWLPAAAIWIPLRHTSSDEQGRGGLLLAGDAPLSENELALLTEWMSIWQHAWRAIQGKPRWSVAAIPSRWRHWWSAPADNIRRRRRGATALAVLAVLLFPVHLTVLAPGELVPANPTTIRAPLDGVIADFSVHPNQAVAKGQVLFEFDQAPIETKLTVAREALSTAQAQYRQAAQIVLNDSRAKAQLASLLGGIAEKQAQADFLEGQAKRSRVIAPQAGVALFDDPQEWIGRPVQTGERVMQVAAPDDVEIEAWIAIGDAIALPDRASAHMYLSVSPLSPLAGTVRYMSPKAAARPDGAYAYRVRARIDGGAGSRVGLKGTVKLVGDRVPFIYWVLRRPLATVRQFLAW